jgi:hypothetical protein
MNKWIYVQTLSGLSFAMVCIPFGLTVAQLKLLLGIDPRSLVTLQSGLQPLAENESLYEHVSNYDTVYIASYRRVGY